MLVAGVAIALIALLGERDHDAAPAATVVVSPTPAARPAGLVLAVATTNVRGEPDRFAPVVAILPGGREVETLGRTSDAAWIRVALAPGGDAAGWVPAASLRIDAGAVQALAVLAAGAAATPEATGTETPSGEALPDIVIADAFLLQDGRLAIALRNIGDAPLVEVSVPLNVSKVSGDILGVLRIGPTTLAPGGTATVVTPVVVSETGSYLLELDRADEIRESREFNNKYTTLLVSGGG